MRKFYLVDEGTLDTVFQCDECGMLLRYSMDAIDRDEEGNIEDMPSVLAMVDEDHHDECPGE